MPIDPSRANGAVPPPLTSYPNAHAMVWGPIGGGGGGGGGGGAGQSLPPDSSHGARTCNQCTSGPAPTSGEVGGACIPLCLLEGEVRPGVDKTDPLPPLLPPPHSQFLSFIVCTLYLQASCAHQQAGETFLQ